MNLNINDYFDEELKNTPFADGAEETMQHLVWYDMFLTAAMYKDADMEGIREALNKGSEYLGSRAASTAGKDITALYGIGLSLAAEEYGLYGFGFFCLLMAAAQETDSHYSSVYTLFEGGEFEGGGLSIALAARLYSMYAGADELMELRRLSNSLRRCPLFTFFPPKEGMGSLYYTFEANRQFASFLKGDYTLDTDLGLICSEEYAVGNELGSCVHGDELYRLRMILEGRDYGKEGPCLVKLTGDMGSGRTQLILHALPADTPVLFFSLDRYMKLSDRAARDAVSNALVRCRIMKEALVIRCESSLQKDFDADSLEFLLERCFEQLDTVFLQIEKDIELNSSFLPVMIYHIALNMPKASERLRLWERELAAFGCGDGLPVKELALKYRLNPGKIRNCAAAAKGASEGRGSSISAKDLTEAILSEATSDLDKLCDRIPLKYTWDDLVIDPRQKEIMETLCSRARLRSLVDEEWGFEEKVTYGRGVSMILYGPPGTGKTMAAQIMAQDIGMSLYRVDLSQLVDKYIGETEKNIGRIFDAASDGNVILFFDEADALFSRRTEVQSSNDKHANTEVAYLLQKIEQHEGVIFLATNRFADFDSAFVRRLTYAVRLERPDAKMRLELFTKILPDKTPRTKDLDLKFFADNFELSGSEIKEVLYSAAFMAAAADKPLGNDCLVKAVKYQQEKTGKLLSAGDFMQYGGLIS